ncbi:hypothetical protein ACOME3_003264 [Neoechinorhynchus agilis]
MLEIDIYEDGDHLPDSLYLFGKVENEANGCAIRVEGVQRRIFLIPKANHSPQQVIDEFKTQISSKYGIGESHLRTVQLKNCFYSSVDFTVDCVQLTFSGPSRFHDFKASYFSTVGHVLGISCSLIENFLLQKSIKGPCWLHLSNSNRTESERSWCSLEINVHCDDVQRIEDANNTPNLRVLSLAIASIPSSQNNKHLEICGVDGLVTEMSLTEPCNQPFTGHNDPRFISGFSVITNSQSVSIPYDFKAFCLQQKTTNIITLPTERGLLSFLLNKIQRIDPDVIVGHDISKTQLQLIISRIIETKAPYWSKLGRLKRSLLPKSIFKTGITCGRLLVDVAVSARELMTKSCRVQSPTSFEMNGKFLGWHVRYFPH